MQPCKMSYISGMAKGDFNDIPAWVYGKSHI